MKMQNKIDDLTINGLKSLLKKPTLVNNDASKNG